MEPRIAPRSGLSPHVPDHDDGGVVPLGLDEQGLDGLGVDQLDDRLDPALGRRDGVPEGGAAGLLEGLAVGPELLAHPPGGEVP